jgi:hypothetical protein
LRLSSSLLYPRTVKIFDANNLSELSDHSYVIEISSLTNQALLKKLK